MNTSTRFPSALSTIACATLTMLAACGGSGGSETPPTPITRCSTCSDGKLAGIASNGAALSAAEITVTGADGKTARAVADADGLYSVDVSSLAAPYVIEAATQLGDDATVLHALATAADVGSRAINVTPLTEVIAGSVLGANPQAALAAGTIDFESVRGSELGAVEKLLEARIAAVLAAVGIAEVDLRSAELKADGSGLSAAVAALKLAVAPGRYTLTLIPGGASIAIDMQTPGDGPALPAPAPADLDGLARNTREIAARLAELSTRFRAGIPAAADLQGFTAPGFLHDGHGEAEFIETVLREQPSALNSGFSFEGVTFDALRVERTIDADTLEISFRNRYRTGFFPTREHMTAKRVGGVWKLAGNGQLTSARVSMMTRLKETAMPESDVKSLPGLFTYVDSSEGSPHTYYMQQIKGDQGQRVDLWLDRVGGESFGRMAWAGDDLGAAPRALRSKYSRLLGTPDSRASNYLEFRVPVTRVSTQVAEIVVTGPGLPSGGLTLTKPASLHPRTDWVFKGDSYHWNAFNAERCPEIDNIRNPVPGCGLDWSKIHRGSEFVFTLKDAAGTVLGTVRDSLRDEPIDEVTAYAQRDRLFPRFQVDGAHAFSVANLWNDARGPFRPGQAVALNWTSPERGGFRVSWVAATMQTQTTDAKGILQPTDYPAVLPLYEAGAAAAVPTSAALKPAHPVPPTWGWATLTGIDANGHAWSHELSPWNPD